jgi:hypothetical protein
VRLRDAIGGGVLFVLLWVPFLSGRVMPLGAVANVVAYIRFNGPVFRLIAAVTMPQIAALVAVGLGLIAAAWARRRLDVSDPAAWAWPMAIALACAPVIYPWYLLYFTPFLFSTSTLPLVLWTFTVIPVYIVWEITHRGGRWVVPPALTVVEYAAPIIAVLLTRRHASGRASAPAAATDELLP